MVQQVKIEAVQNLAEKIKQAKSLVLVDFSNLSVPLQNKLRQTVVEAGGEFRVVKNNLFKLAFKKGKTGLSDRQAGLSPDFDFEKIENLRGPTAALFSLKDELAPLKVLVQFIKDYQLPRLKFGFFEGQLIDKEKIETLAKIPNQEVLITQTISLINSPLSGLVSGLQSNLNQLVGVLENIKSQAPRPV